eukprot:TRINITY_DN544_c0_g2_i1.p1 TRINITY_DN544_c0_g2~~TRINITY_DN544_c0_g2_i1.p1  ORF type:complete len:315 (+),score=80.84 TRINITY_DN544_c0_g2_i1:191-1135(+)
MGRRDHNTARHAKFLTKGDDAIYEELQRSPERQRALSPDEDLPGMGQFYGLHCDREDEDGEDDYRLDDMAKRLATAIKVHLPELACERNVVHSNMEKESAISCHPISSAAKDAKIELSKRVGVRKSSRDEASWVPEVHFSKSDQCDTASKPAEGLDKKLQESTVWKTEKVLQDGLLVPPRDPKKINKLAREQRKDTLGSKWFDMPAPTLTPELQKDLQLLKMRDVIDPKRHYKADDSKKIPKYFQVGTVIEPASEFYSRLSKKERKPTIADELLSDPVFNQYRKRKHLEIERQHNPVGKNRYKKRKKTHRKQRH